MVTVHVWNSRFIKTLSWTVNMRFILVRFFDGIIHIVNSKQIKKNRSFVSAKYTDGYYYKCNILLENGKYLYSWLWNVVLENLISVLECLNKAKNQLDGKLWVNLYCQNECNKRRPVNLTNFINNLPVYC